jgi:hypothetical protein
MLHPEGHYDRQDVPTTVDPGEEFPWLVPPFLLPILLALAFLYPALFHLYGWITRSALEGTILLDWNPQGTRTGGRPRKTWMRSVTEEAQREERTWREVTRLGADGSRWRSSVLALCSYTGDNRN